MIENVLNGNASTGTLSSFIVILNVLKCYVAEINGFSILKQVTVNL